MTLAPSDRVYRQWGAIGLGLAAARNRVAVVRESPEDIKWCPVCGDHHILLHDEAIQSPLNRLYHKFCPICVDKHKDDLDALEREWAPKLEEVPGDAT